ncbi:MAG: hypothetical protein QOF02_2355 [Blastocatellia bacterium]|jgi:hypothetical protein|nr:hypothetical protein [Blastocatellia bacterium]
MARKLYGSAFLMLIALSFGATAPARGQQDDSEFGPVVRAYLGYLRGEQEVVDDRNSRHEISAVYYRRNSNRIRALRLTAIRLARESGNDFLPELEAVVAGEFGSLFENPPKPAALRAGKVFGNTFRFLGAVRAIETFYVFARLDPYEQAEMMEQEKATRGAAPQAPTGHSTSEGQTRSRRATAP